VLDYWVVFGLGILGGCANVAAVGRGVFGWPTATSQGFHLGFLNAAFLGGVAALVTFWLGDLGKLAMERQLGLSVVSGIGGGAIIAGWAERQKAAVEKAKKDRFSASADEADRLAKEVLTGS